MTEEVLQPECYKRHAEIENHIKEGKGWRATIITVGLAIFIQVGAFLVMWGSLTTTVKKNTDYLWGDITPKVHNNIRDIDRILTKLDSIKMIAIMGDKGEKGDKGDKGRDGK